MPANPDFKDLFRIFNEENVEYLVVGAHAVIFYAEPRYTKDLDIWINSTALNAARVYRALGRFGAPLRDIQEEDFTESDLIYQIGIAPNRIDILMSIAGVNFDEAWADRTESSYDGVPIHILGKDSLIKAKKATGRPQDILDMDRLNL
jgi:hypothetical protein